MVKDRIKRIMNEIMKEEELSDEELLTVLLGKMFNHMYAFIEERDLGSLGKMFNHMYAFIEERDLGSEFAMWIIKSRNEALFDLIRLGSVGDRIIEKAEG